MSKIDKLTAGTAKLADSMDSLTKRADEMFGDAEKQGGKSKVAQKWLKGVLPKPDVKKTVGKG